MVRELAPATAIMSLIVPAEHRNCVRSTFCEQSLFFRSEQAAAGFLATHPEALILAIAEAAYIGKLVAAARFTRKKRGNM